LERIKPAAAEIRGRKDNALRVHPENGDDPEHGTAPA
jgi:hypothetical protein